MQVCQKILILTMFGYMSKAIAIPIVFSCLFLPLDCEVRVSIFLLSRYYERHVRIQHEVLRFKESSLGMHGFYYSLGAGSNSTGSDNYLLVHVSQ